MKTFLIVLFIVCLVIPFIIFLVSLVTQQIIDKSYKSLLGKMLEGNLSEEEYSVLQKIEKLKKENNQRGKSNSNDDSLLDLVNLNYKISPKDTTNMGSKNKLKKLKRLQEQQIELNLHKGIVPRWEFRYIYFHTEITQATPAQKEFYAYLRKNFFEGKYLNVEGNVNYISILVHELFHLYKTHLDFNQLENQLQVIGKKYPETGDFTDRVLQAERDRLKRVEMFKLQREQLSNFGYRYFSSYKKFGDTLKDVLKLNESEVELLNLIKEPNNNFFSITFVSHEVIKLFLKLVSTLEEESKKEKTTLDDVLKEISDFVAKKHYNYRRGSRNYNSCVENTLEEIYKILFRCTENTVRQHYGYKSKLNISFSEGIAKSEIHSKLIHKAELLLTQLVENIKEIDKATDTKLYTIDSNRWKIKYAEIKDSFENTHKSVDTFMKEFETLSKLNESHPSSHRQMFFEAAKYMLSFDNEKAIILYLTYIYHDLKSSAQIKEFTKKQQKELFKTEEQLSKFTTIREELMKMKSLENALQQVPSIFHVERKKIILDSSSIKEVQNQHSQTVDLLNEYLQDEKETKKETKKEAKTSKKSTSKIVSKTSTKTTKITPSSSNYLSELNLTDIQKTVLDTFKENKFALSHKAFEKLATQNGMFKNQLLESINEATYELLDDILIEEEDKNYTIYEMYYQKLVD